MDRKEVVIFLGFIGKAFKKLKKIKPLKILGKAASAITGIEIHGKSPLPAEVQQAAGAVTYAEQAYETRRSLGAKRGPAILGAIGETADVYSVGGGAQAFLQNNSTLIMVALVGLVLIFAMRARR